MRVKHANMDPWLFSVVYDTPNYGLRRKLGVTFDQKGLGTDGPWLSVRKYNTVLFAYEVSSPENWTQHKSTGFQD